MQGERYEQMRTESLREHGTPRPCSVQINRYYLEHLDGLFPRKHIFWQSGGLVASLVSAVWRPLMQCLYCPVLVTTLATELLLPPGSTNPKLFFISRKVVQHCTQYLHTALHCPLKHGVQPIFATQFQIGKIGIKDDTMACMCHMK